MNSSIPNLEIKSALIVDSPLTGEWVALNTPAERVPSHGTDFFGQRYAFDFARLQANGKSFSTQPLWKQFFGCVNAKHFLAWNQPVLAAFSGKVLAAADGQSDRQNVNSLWEIIRANIFQQRPQPDDLRPLLGNHILIGSDVGVALYAHLRHGSLCVKQGDVVTSRQFIAAVGNSGNSTMPHLHFHVMDSADPWSANGLFCAFRGCRLGTDGENETNEAYVPGLMQRFFCADPV